MHRYGNTDSASGSKHQDADYQYPQLSQNGENDEAVAQNAQPTTNIECPLEDTSFSYVTPMYATMPTRDNYDQLTIPQILAVQPFLLPENTLDLDCIVEKSERPSETGISLNDSLNLAPFITNREPTRCSNCMAMPSYLDVWNKKVPSRTCGICRETEVLPLRFLGADLKRSRYLSAQNYEVEVGPAYSLYTGAPLCVLLVEMCPSMQVSGLLTPLCTAIENLLTDAMNQQQNIPAQYLLVTYCGTGITTYRRSPIGRIVSYEYVDDILQEDGFEPVEFAPQALRDIIPVIHELPKIWSANDTQSRGGCQLSMAITLLVKYIGNSHEHSTSIIAFGMNCADTPVAPGKLFSDETSRLGRICQEKKLMKMGNICLDVVLLAQHNTEGTVRMLTRLVDQTGGRFTKVDNGEMTALRLQQNIRRHILFDAEPRVGECIIKIRVSPGWIAITDFLNNKATDFARVVAIRREDCCLFKILPATTASVGQAKGAMSYQITTLYQDSTGCNYMRVNSGEIPYQNNIELVKQSVQIGPLLTYTLRDAINLGHDELANTFSCLYYHLESFAKEFLNEILLVEKKPRVGTGPMSIGMRLKWFIETSLAFCKRGILHEGTVLKPHRTHISLFRRVDAVTVRSIAIGSMYDVCLGSKESLGKRSLPLTVKSLKPTSAFLIVKKEVGAYLWIGAHISTDWIVSHLGSGSMTNLTERHISHILLSKRNTSYLSNILRSLYCERVEVYKQGGENEWRFHEMLVEDATVSSDFTYASFLKHVYNKSG